jgi:hypothetical protein
MNLRLNQPSDPYDTAAWMAFYAQNPGFRRSVGAEGVNDDPADPPADPPADTPPADTPPADPPADPPKKDDPPADPPKKDGMTDKEAELLRESMKRKAELQELKKKYEGIDPDKYREFQEQQTKAQREAEEAERKKLEAEGKFDEVKRQMNEAHETRVNELSQTLQSKDAEIEALRGQISELTIGSGFESSNFLKENTVLPPSKARALYGAHFEIEDGKPVAYDKPRGAQGRAPLVDGRGDPLGFEAAIEKIVKSDSDWESLARAKIKPGSDSRPGDGARQQKSDKPMTSQEKILSGLGDLMSQKGNDMPTL